MDHDILALLIVTGWFLVYAAYVAAAPYILSGCSSCSYSGGAVA